MGKRLGLQDVISFDMGGTTAKASLILGGVPKLTWDYEVGGPAHTGGFLSRGSGHPLRVPVVDLAEVGTGGGSLAWIDEGGALRIGPQSAGADPGPACYGRGGDKPTVTDADAVLGYLDTSGAKPGLGQLNGDAARNAVQQEVAEPLGLTIEAAAAGIFALANAQMAGAVRLVSMAKGHDPREFVLMAFGGAGPVHAWAVARELGVSQVVIPPFAGVSSAAGLLQADFRVDLSRGFRTRLSDTGRARSIPGIFEELRSEGLANLAGQGHADGEVEITYSADMRYLGQSYDVLVEFPATPGDLDAAAAAFHAEHHRAYGHARPEADVEITVLRLSATAPGVGYDFGDAPGAESGGASQADRREVRFDDRGVPATVIGRFALAGEELVGPALLEENDTTIVVPPSARASVDRSGFVTLRLEDEVLND